MNLDTKTKSKVQNVELFISEVDEQYCAMKARELFYKRLADMEKQDEEQQKLKYSCTK